MKRWELLNWFVARFGYQTYLEIGIDNPGRCFDLVKCRLRVGVDPRIGQTVVADGREHYRQTSDEFFAREDRKFGLVFVDGLHLADQVVRDVDGALAHLAPNGTIVVHDCAPGSLAEALPERRAGLPWYGTVWHGWMRLRAARWNLHMRVLMVDRGCGIIRMGNQVLYGGPTNSWADFQAHRHEVLLPLYPRELEATYK